MYIRFFLAGLISLYLFLAHEIEQMDNAVMIESLMSFDLFILGATFC